MTKDQAIAQGYADQVDAVEKINCEFTGGLMPDPMVIEFSATHKWIDSEGYQRTITAYYYQDQDDVNAIEDGDLGSLDWVAAKFEVA